MFRYRLKTLIAIVTLTAIALGIWANWDAIPGTYYQDVNGLPHGTGEAVYRYDDGSIMVRESYFRGLVYRTTWFKPDGSEIATEHYDKESGGAGYYVRQDGSIESKYHYSYSPTDNAYVADGEAVFYSSDGTIQRKVIFENGQEMGED